MKIGKRTKVILAIVVCLVFVCGTAFFTACGDENEPSGEVTLERIAVTKKPTRTDYTVGDKFSRAGMVVTAYYSDESSAPVLGYSIDKTGPLTTADTKVTVTYKEKSDSVDIVVKEKEVAVQLEIKSAETFIYKVEAEDCVLASELLGTSKEKYIEYHSAAEGNPATSGGKSLGNLNFSNDKISMTVKSDVKAKISIDMCMSNNPSIDFDTNVRTEWNGEKIDTGFVVRYEEGAPYAWFDWHEYTLENLELNVGLNVLSLTILNYSVNYDYFKINVNPTDAELTGIAVTTPPTKTVYGEGELFDPTGMVVTATYDDGITVPGIDYTVDKTRLALGDTEVVVSYKGQTASVPITVNPRTAALSEISATPPIKTVYAAGDYFRDAGMTVTAIYDDGSEEAADGYTIEDVGPLAAGETAVTVSYGGKTTQVPISVGEASGLKHLEVTNADTATYRVEAEDALMTKNRETDSWKFEDHDDTQGNPTTSNGKSLGWMNLTTTGIQVIIDSKVDAPLSISMRMAYNPELLFDARTATYWNGARLTTGFKVEQTDSTYDWFDWHYYVVSDLALKKGKNVLEFINLGGVTVSYDCFDFNVSPRTAVLSEISATPPIKTVYAAGDYFRDAGMTVTAIYDDGSEEAADGYTIDKTGPLAAGETAVTVSYGGKTTQVPISVGEASGLKHLEVTNADTATYRVEAEDALLTKNRETDSWQIEIHDENTGNPETSNGKSLGWMNKTTTGIQVIVDSKVDATVSISLRLANNGDLPFDATTATYWNGVRLTAGFTVTKDAGALYEWFDWHDYTLTGLTLKQGINVFELITLGGLTVSYDCFDINVNPPTAQRR